MFDLARMLPPVWLLVLVLGSIYALITVTLFGLGRCRFVTLLVTSILGVAVGHIASDIAGWRLPSMGDFHILQATVVALVLLVLTRMAVRGQPVRR